MSTGLKVVGTTLFGLISGVFLKVSIWFRPVTSPAVYTLEAFLQRQGVDLRKIPSACLAEIVERKTEEAKLRMHSGGDAWGARRGWARHLRTLLHREAGLIHAIVRDGPENYLGLTSTRALLKYGVVEPRYPPIMTTEEFLEACERGTLLAELDHRILLRNQR